MKNEKCLGMYSNVIYYVWYEDAKSSSLADQASWFHKLRKDMVPFTFISGAVKIKLVQLLKFLSSKSEEGCLSKVLWMRVKRIMANKLDKWTNVHNLLSILSFVKVIWINILYLMYDIVSKCMKKKKPLVLFVPRDCYFPW